MHFSSKTGAFFVSRRILSRRAALPDWLTASRWKSGLRLAHITDRFGRILASVPAAATKNVSEDEVMSTPDARYRNPVDYAPDAGNRFREIGYGEVRY